VTAAHEAAASGARKNLNAVRVIQRNLVYVTNIATTLAKEDVLKRHEYFGQYGRIVKIVVNRGTVHHTAHGQSVSAYVTFHKKADALACILAVDGATLENRVLRASFGTTKYCNFFLRGIPCSNPECVPADHEILTERGFMDLAAYQAAADRPRVAGYDVTTRQLRFEAPHSLVTKDGTHQLVELVSAAAHAAAVSMQVTLDHDLFAQAANGGDYEKVPASTFVAPDGERDTLRQLAHAAGGVQQPGDSRAPFAAVCAALGLDTPLKERAFLELYGFWLAEGSLGVRNGAPTSVQFGNNAEFVECALDTLDVQCDARGDIVERSWCDWWFAEYGHVYDGGVDLSRVVFDAVSSAAGSFLKPEAGRASKWLASWVWSLDMAQLRHIIGGVQRADGARHVWTASARFRDELVRVALMAGYSAHFVAVAHEKRQTWRLSISDHASVCEPLLTKQRDVVRQVPFDGQVWCFTMPSGFVWVRRVTKDAAGVVTEASRALLTGNCMYLHEIGDDADSFTKEDMQGGKSNFYEQIHAANMVNKVAPPAPAGARRKTLLPPAGTVSGGFRLYGPKMNPERSGPQPLTLASVPITVVGAGGKRTIAAPHSGGATLGSATGARVGYSPPKSAAAAAAAAQSTWGTWTVPTRTPAAPAPAPSISAPSSTGDVAWADIASKGLTSSAGGANVTPPTATTAAATATPATSATAPTPAAAPATSTAAGSSVSNTNSRFAFASQQHESESASDELEERAATPPFIDVTQADWPTQLRTLMPNARVRFSTQANPTWPERGQSLVENSPSHVAAPAHEVRAIMIEMFIRDRCRPYMPPMHRTN
jgi:hypothetical protein